MAESCYPTFFAFWTMTTNDPFAKILVRQPRSSPFCFVQYVPPEASFLKFSISLAARSARPPLLSPCGYAVFFY